MNKREFLAMGGALPLMLAGCGGSGSGSAPVRLVNASVGYPALGFMVESTQATTADVAYGATSPYESVEAGAVGVTLTVANASATSAQIRTINKDTRYSLVAFGFLNELKSVLLTESTIVPDDGKANVNVLNASVDIGGVDVYLSASKDLSISTLIATNVVGVSQSAFAGILAGSYYVTVTGKSAISDVRFQTPAPIVLTALQVLTIILTPGASGILANAILLTQGDTGTAVSYLNTTARLRAVTSVGGKSAVVTGVLPASTKPQYSEYFVVDVGVPPVVKVDGVTIPTTQTLAAGGDYTLMVYIDGLGNVVSKLVEDNNTAPLTASGVKFRLINLASNNQGLSLSMSVNSISVASNIPYATASAYTEIPTPQTANSRAEVFNGSDSLIFHDQIMTLPNIFTEIIVSVDESGTPIIVKDFFRAAAGSISSS